MKRFVTLLIILALTFAGLQQAVSAQEVLLGEKVTRSRKASKYLLPIQDVEKPKSIIKKGSCVVNIDNHTGFFIDVWIDRVYAGRINPWAGIQVVFPKRWVEFFCKSVGESFIWETEGECNEHFIIKLNSLE